jgi:hypothetical protein
MAKRSFARDVPASTTIGTAWPDGNIPTFVGSARPWDLGVFEVLLGGRLAGVDYYYQSWIGLYIIWDIYPPA